MLIRRISARSSVLLPLGDTILQRRLVTVLNLNVVGDLLMRSVDQRCILDAGRRAEAEPMLREALSICRDAGMQFCGPKVLSALSRTVEDSGERASLLAEGNALLLRGSVGHNHLWFYRDAIEAYLTAGDARGALEYVGRLEEYTCSEPLTWADLFAARGHALAAAQPDGPSEAVRRDLIRVRTALGQAGMAAFLPPVDSALGK